MNYKLNVTKEISGYKRTCACGKCSGDIIIHDSAKKDFMKVMKWDEEMFAKHTTEIEE